MPIMNTFCEDENAPAFPLGKAELIEKMKRLTETSFGTDKPENNDLLADDFQFRFPIVELDKPKFIKAFGAFKVDDAFPDMQTQYYGFRLDPNIPGRLWYDQIGEGVHSGQFGGAFAHVKPSGKSISLPPQTMSMTFNEAGQLTYFTGGYVVDRRMGNTGGLGGLFGILHGTGNTLPFPEGRPFKLSWQFRFFALIGQATDTLKAAYAQYQAGGVSGVVTYTRELVASVLPASFAKLLKTA